jgi:hypothetical protein
MALLPLLHSWSELSSVYGSTPSSKFGSISSITTIYYKRHSKCVQLLKAMTWLGYKASGLVYAYCPGSLGPGLGIPLRVPTAQLKQEKSAQSETVQFSLHTRIKSSRIFLSSLRILATSLSLKIVS